MKAREYIEMARLAIDCINAKTMTIAEVREYWSAVSNEEPALNLNRQRTRAGLVEQLEIIIGYCNETGRMVNTTKTHALALEMNAQRDADNAAGMEKMMKHLKMVANAVIPTVRDRITPNTSDDEAVDIIHEAILHWSDSFANFTRQYLTFNTDQRLAFAEIMYELVAPTAQNVKTTLNPVYEKFVTETGKTGALNFICHQLTPAPVYSIYQRADGMQLAVNANGTASFMRPFKQASWLRAGFEANLEYYWLVEKGVEISEPQNSKAFYEEGILKTEEVI